MEIYSIATERYKHAISKGFTVHKNIRVEHHFKKWDQDKIRNVISGTTFRI